MQAFSSSSAHSLVDFSSIESVTIEALETKTCFHPVKFKILGKSEYERKKLKCHEIDALVRTLSLSKVNFSSLDCLSLHTCCSCSSLVQLKQQEEKELEKIKKISTNCLPERNFNPFYLKAFSECLAFIKSTLGQLQHQPKCSIIVPTSVNFLFDKIYEYFEEAGLTIRRKDSEESEFVFNYLQIEGHDTFCRIEVDSEEGKWSNENLFKYLPLANKTVVVFAFTSAKQISPVPACENHLIELWDSADQNRFYLNLLTGIAYASGLPKIASHFMDELKVHWQQKMEKYALEAEPIIRIFAPLPLLQPVSLLQAEAEKEEEFLEESDLEAAELENEEEQGWVWGEKEWQFTALLPSLAFEECLAIMKSLDKPRNSEKETIFFDIVNPLGNSDEDPESYGLSGELELLGFKNNEGKRDTSHATFVVYTQEYELKRKKCDEIKCPPKLLESPQKTTVFLFKECGISLPEIQLLKDNGSLVVDLSDVNHPGPYWERLRLFSKIMQLDRLKMPADKGEQGFELYLKKKYKELIGMQEETKIERIAYQECLSLIKVEIGEALKKCLVIDFGTAFADSQASSFLKDLKSAGFALVHHTQNQARHLAEEVECAVVVLSNKHFSRPANVNLQEELKNLEKLVFSLLEKKLDKVILIKGEDFKEDTLHLEKSFSFIETGAKKEAESLWLKLEKIVHLAGISEKKVVSNRIEKSFMAFLTNQWQKKLNLLSEQIEEEEAALEKLEKENALLAPKEFKREDCICPITREYMEDPVTASDNYNYEASAIKRWIAQNGTSPITRETLSDILIPNSALRISSEQFRKCPSREF